MSPSKTDSREFLRQGIDAEIKALEGSIRALRRRRNALAPVSSLPTEVILTIFSLSRAPTFIIPGIKPKPLRWLRVTHVCHQWREIALNQSLLWNHLDFNAVSLDGAAEILARAKIAPLHLEAKFQLIHWDDARFRAFRKELQDHVSHIRHLDFSIESVHFNRTLDGLTSPAPTLEHLSLTRLDRTKGMRGFVTNTLFDGSTPRLSRLELRNCAISWTSPLLRGLKHLNISLPFERPSLPIWLDALDKMPQLETLNLFRASPIASPHASLSSSVTRVITLPSLTHFEMSCLARDCGLALAHLILPALIALCIKAESCCLDGSDVLELLSHVARCAHGLQHTQPIQSAFVRSQSTGIEIIAWPEPEVDIKLPNETPIVCTTHSERVEFSLMNTGWSLETHTDVFNAVMAALPLNGLVTLTAEKHTRLDKQFWLRHAPQWPLLRCMRLGNLAAHGFREMLLAEDNGGRESPVLPLLTKLVLIDTTLSARRTRHLCDALRKRVEQGVPLEILDLSTCYASSGAVELLSEIVVEILGPEEGLDSEPDAQIIYRWRSGGEDYHEDDPDPGIDDEEWDDGDTDDDPPD
jgi:hypothetical protein